jgi:type II secretory pathway predicted ATPase ExeA
MYLEHFGLSEVPFRITPHTEFFFSGANRGATLEALVYIVTHDDGIIKVTGEVGSGKTMLCRVLMERLPANVVIVYLANPSLSRDDILFAIADDLDLKVPDGARTSAVVRLLQSKLIELHAQGRQVAVLIDEAHAMPLETLEEIRLLSNLETSYHKLLQLVIFGQPELDSILARPDMRQLKERITQNFKLEPMLRDDIAEYLEFRMRTAGYRGPTIFSPAAVKLIASASLGLTRRVNILAEKSLLAAFAEGSHEVTPKEVYAAIRDTEYTKPLNQPKRRIVVVAAIVAVVAFVVVAFVTSLSRQETTVAPIASGLVQAPQPVQSSASSTQTSESKENLASQGSENVPDNSSASMSKGVSSLADTASSPTIAPATATALAAAVSRLRPSAQERLRETQQWIQTTDGKRWFVQLVATNTDEIDYAQYFLATADRLLKPDHARLYVADTGKEQRIGIIYGEFPSLGAAQAAIAQLPPELRNGNPFPRQVLWLK